MSECASCLEARERLLPQFRFVHAACGHATNCPEHLKHARVLPGAIPLEAMLEERTRQVREGRKFKKFEAWIGVVLFALSAALAVGAMLAWAGVLR